MILDDLREFGQRVEHITHYAFEYLTGEELTKPKQCNATLHTLANMLGELARDYGIRPNESTPTITDYWTNPHDGKPARYKVVVKWDNSALYHLEPFSILPRS